MRDELIPVHLPLELLQCGKEWDAVQMPLPMGERVRAQLGSACGLAFADEEHLSILVSPGMGAAVGAAEARVYGAGDWMSVPAPDRIEPPGPHWLLPPGRCRLTQVQRLRAALDAVHKQGAGS